MGKNGPLQTGHSDQFCSRFTQYASRTTSGDAVATEATGHDSRAAHRVAAVVAPIAGGVADGD